MSDFDFYDELVKWFNVEYTEEQQALLNKEIFAKTNDVQERIVLELLLVNHKKTGKPTPADVMRSKREAEHLTSYIEAGKKRHDNCIVSYVDVSLPEREEKPMWSYEQMSNFLEGYKAVLKCEGEGRRDAIKVWDREVMNSLCESERATWRSCSFKLRVKNFLWLLHVLLTRAGHNSEDLLCLHPYWQRRKTDKSPNFFGT